MCQQLAPLKKKSTLNLENGNYWTQLILGWQVLDLVFEGLWDCGNKRKLEGTKIPKKIPKKNQKIKKS